MEGEGEWRRGNRKKNESCNGSEFQTQITQQQQQNESCDGSDLTQMTQATKLQYKILPKMKRKEEEKRLIAMLHVR